MANRKLRGRTPVGEEGSNTETFRYTGKPHVPKAGTKAKNRKKKPHRGMKY